MRHSYSGSARHAVRPLVACLAMAFALEAPAALRGNKVAASTEHLHADHFLNPVHRPMLPERPAYLARKSNRPTPDKGPHVLAIVTNCDDAGPGSLRDAVAAAVDGDTIDLKNLPLNCSAITLTTGAIHVLVDNLTVSGPGADVLTIDGGVGPQHFNRVFHHNKAGTLTLMDVTVAHGNYQSGTFEGGCIYSFGSVSLISSVVTDCMAYAPPGSNANAFGGGVFAREELYMWGSTVTRSTAASADRAGYGGGIFSNGDFKSLYSTISNNLAIAQKPQYFATGGGAMIISYGDVIIRGSTFFGNSAQQVGALFDVASGTTEITNSTISDNSASEYVGGAAFYYSATISNSTIASNSSGKPDAGVGVFVADFMTLTASSSIFSSNWSGDTELDIFAETIFGGDNIIRASSSDPPGDTLTACPRLSNLQDNGGPTLTRSLLSGSVGIDAGNNVPGLTYDQRQAGFARKFGSQVDIGAVEWQGDFGDSIFSSAFEVHCD